MNKESIKVNGCTTKRTDGEKWSTTTIKTPTATKATGWMDWDTAKESTTFSMATCTTDLGPTIKNKATANSKCRQATCIKVAGKMAKSTDSASTLSQTATTTKGNSLKEWGLEREFISGSMEVTTRGSGKPTRWMVTGHIAAQTE